MHCDTSKGSGDVALFFFPEKKTEPYIMHFSEKILICRTAATETEVKKSEKFEICAEWAWKIR